MASAAADKKFSPMLHSWKWNVKTNRKMMIILTVLHMVAAPAVFFSELAGIFSGNGVGYSYDIYVSIGTLTTLAAGFMGIIIGVNSFNCLHKKSVVDMKLSLPMTSDQRFVSDFLSGLFVYMAPFLAAQVVSLLLAGFGLVFLEGKTLYEKNYYGKSTPYVCEFFTDATAILLKLILCGILTMLMLYTLTVLITVCCGSRFECIAYSIGVNVVIPVTIFMVTISMFEDIFGIDPEYNALRIFMVTSPAGGIYTAAEWALDGTDYLSDMRPAVWAVLFFLLTALMGVLAFFLYRKRRAEQVSKPFVFKLAYYIVITGVMFCICSLFYMAGKFIPAVIITAVVYMIAEVVTNRGFKKFKQSAIRYIATVAAAYFIVFMGQSTDGFGALNRVPASMTVASVDIDYTGIYNDFKFSYSDKITLRDRENIKAVIDAHKTILEEYEDYIRSDRHMGMGNRQNYNDVKYSYTLTIKYRLISGGIIERRYYSVLTPDVEKILSSINYTDEYKKQTAKIYTAKIRDWEEQYLSMRKSDHYDVSDYKASLTRYARISNSASTEPSEVYMLNLYKHGFFDRLAEAYSQDIMAIDRSNYSTSDTVNRYTVYKLGSGGYYSPYSIWIPKSFENTLRLLEEYGFEIP